MRIALVLTGSTGGIGRHVASLAPRLVQRGHQVRVLCPAETAYAHRLDRGGVGVLPLHRVGALRGADVVHAHGYKAGGFAVAALVGARRPLVATWHNAVLGSGPSVRIARILQRVVARSADLTLGASTDLVDEALRLGAPAARLGAVAAPLLPPPTHSASEVRASLGLAPADVLVLTVSRLAPQKNLGMLLDVAAAARDEPRLVFAVVGDGPLHDSLAARITADRSRVRLLGRRSDIADLLGAADLALLTSTWEARALVAQEALVAGVPLVSTRVGGIEELVGDAAVLVEPGDVTSTTAALRELMSDPARRAALGRRGRLRAATWPSEADVATDVLGAYAQVMARARRVR